METEKELQSSNIFKDYVVETENLFNELKKTSKAYSVSISEIEFDLISYKTYAKNLNEEQQDWDLIEQDDLIMFDDESVLLKKTLEIKQLYTVKILHKSNVEESVLDGFKFKIASNKDFSKVYLAIEKGSKITYTPNLARTILHAIENKKVRNKLLLGIHQNELKESIKKLVTMIKSKGKILFLDRKMMMLNKGLEQIMPIDDQFIFTYLKKHNNKDEYGRIDYSNRGYILDIKDGEIIAQYIKAKPGKAGRNCKGQYLEVREPYEHDKPNYKVSDDIDVKEDENGIVYRATKNGYVVIDDDTIKIENFLELEEITFKNTGSIKSNIDSDVNIFVKHKDNLTDAVGEGIEISVEKIRIEGYLGAKTLIQAKSIEVLGQTHKDSRIIADKINIHTHKGCARGKNIEIEDLEQGVLYGENIYIKEANGGIINCESVFIENLKSHVTIYASKNIEIVRNEGNENSIFMTPKALTSDKEILESYILKNNNITNEIKHIQFELKKLQSILENNKENINIMKKKLGDIKIRNSSISLSFQKMVSTYKKLKYIINEKKKLLEYKKKSVNYTDLKKETIQNGIKDAKIINHGVWSGYNRVTYELLVPELSIDFVPKDFFKNSEITLTNINGKYQISQH